VPFGNAVVPEVKASYSVFVFGYVSNPVLFWWDLLTLVKRQLGNNSNLIFLFFCCGE